MEFFRPGSNINFMAARKWAMLFSALLFVISIASLAVNGLEWGLDFTGGTQIELSFHDPVDVETIRNRLQAVNFRIFSDFQ